ncbi:protein fluG-like isoform X3 [Cajanus cajan]|uniref:protein fluG-like isoform X3 n=1 Tax=Cajanus cajan TaxID=3821 RepID=UPI0010FBAC75|nr:protein fluG-like isoform X3 [Cajanus cajan]
MDISLLFTVLFAILIFPMLFNPRATAIEELEYSVVEGEKMDFSELRKAVEEVEVVDGHSHNIVASESNSVYGFIQAFTVGAFGDAEAFAFAQQSLSFKGLHNGSPWTIDSFTEAYISKLKSVVNEIYALKSIAAYYGGLEINLNVAKTDAEEDLRQLLNAGKPFFLLNSKNLVSYIFLQSLEIALSYDLPMQIHTGFGDRFLDLRKSNPLHLRAILEDKRYAKCRFVLLHASYPFSKEASYLASVYSQVYLDFGLAIPKLSVHGMISSVKDLINLAPLTKVMFSADAYTFPETFYLGAKNSREVIFSVLRDACIDGDLSIPEAVEAAKDIFARNAIRFYNISSAKSAP